MPSTTIMHSLASNPTFVESVSVLYGQGKLDYEAARYSALYDAHVERFGEDGEFYSSPGRIEVCGNHTDHNNGKVLCASITVDTLAVVTPCQESEIVIASEGYPVVKIDLEQFFPRERERGTSEALVRGVCAYYRSNGYAIGGFRASTTSDVFKGAGVSSSACFEVLVCEILNQLYNDGKVDRIAEAKASHYAESEFFGKPCGLMDQSAIALGGVSYIDFRFPNNPKVSTVDWRFDDTDIILINTGGDHCDLTNQYASIRSEMEDVARLMGARTLRTVKEEVFYAALPALQRKTSGRSILRTMHYFDENKRVTTAARAVKFGKKKVFFACVNASGESSYKLLQNCYPVGDTEQRIPLALSLSKRFDGVKAVRVHGGGFAGTVIAYVDKAQSESFINGMAYVFGKETIFCVGVRNVGACKVNIDG